VGDDESRTAKPNLTRDLADNLVGFVSDHPQVDRSARPIWHPQFATQDLGDHLSRLRNLGADIPQLEVKPPEREAQIAFQQLVADRSDCVVSINHFVQSPGAGRERLPTLVLVAISSLAIVSGIGVLREGPLHAAVKAILAQPGDRLEVPVGRFVIDVVRADGELVEVQTGNFGPLGVKLDALLDRHRVRIVYPVAGERRIVRVDERGEIVSMRRSGKRGTVVEVFDKLVAFPSLLTHPNLTIEVLLLGEDHIRAARGPTTVRRRTRDPGERRLRDVLSRVELRGVDDVVRALPPLPPEQFSTRELASVLGCSLLLAQRTAYCLRAVNIIEEAGRRGRTPLHRVV
jgi:hypothetical protein